MPSYTTATLLDTIKRKSFIPAVQGTFTDADLLAIATEEVHNTILPAILNTREEFYVYQNTVTVDTTNVIPYPIPSRAVGMMLRELSLTTGAIERNLPRLEIEDKIFDDRSGRQYGFYLQGNDIYVLGSQVGTLNIYYYLRPGDLIVTSSAATISAIDAGNKQLTLSTIPSGWVVGNSVDIINQNPGFNTKQLENEITAINGTVVTFQDDFATNSAGTIQIQVGNWVSLEGTSPVPQMPLEFFQYLAEAVTAYVMESQGDQEGYTRAHQRMKGMLEAAQKTISPRVDGEGKKCVSPKFRGTISYNSNNWGQY